MRSKAIPCCLPLFALAIVSIPALTLFLLSCGATPQKRAQPGAAPVMREIDPALRGLIGSMTTLRGREPLLVSGYGLVVDLDGAGSADMPVNIRAYMEREMAVRGVGQISRGFGGMTPSQLLNDPNTAVVFVQASIPPGAPEGTRFDVLVRALPGTSTTSLEGGRLWTTNLFRGTFVPGGPATEALAEAKGQIFINPFVDPAEATEDAFSSTTGRILNGGVVKRGLDLLLVLDNASHARARSIVSAINAKFPQESGDRLPTATGRSEEIIELRVPRRFRSDTARFVELLMHTRVDSSFPQEYALRYARAIREQPELAESLLWSLQALGPIALPQIRDMYSYGEQTPRLAALQAGASLADPLVEPHLIELAEAGPVALRTRAIQMLGKLKPDPSTNIALRRFLYAPEMDIRIAAYEALQERFDPAIERINVEEKFLLDIVPFGDPMVYITQQGQPRIVIFGEEPEIARPTFASAWDDRLMITADSSMDDLRVYYRDFKTNRVTTSQASVSLPKFVQFIAHQSTPEAPAPGLNLSYSETVGALYEIWKADGYRGVFVAEQDRLLADLIRSTQSLAADERAETSQDTPIAEEAPALPDTLERPASRPEREFRYVVPLKKPSETTGGSRD